MKLDKYLILIITIFFVSFSIIATAQDDLEALLEDETEEITTFVSGTFQTTRVINGHSVSQMPKRGLDLRISHRFGQFNSGFNDFWGLDESRSFLSLEYGVNDWVMVGVGRATHKNTINGFTKVSIARQTEGKRSFPVSIVYHGAIAANSTIYDDKLRNEDFKSRLDFTNQILIGSKIVPEFSLQISPTHVHRNLVGTREESNDIFAIGYGGRYKILKHVSLNVEFFQVFGNKELETKKYYNPVALGFDIQTSRHVFQLHVTNCPYMTDNAFIGETDRSFWDGDIRFGFNISQVFTIGGHKPKKQ